MATASGESTVPDTLMAIVTGIATILMLLKTQSVMMQFSYVSMGARNMKQLGGQFMNGVSYMTGKTKTVAGAISSKTESARKARAIAHVETQAVRTGKRHSISYANKKGTVVVTHTATPMKSRTGTTYEAPKVTVTRVQAANLPRYNGQDKAS